MTATFIVDFVGGFYLFIFLDYCLLVVPAMKDSCRVSSAWRSALLSGLILQTKLNGFPLEGLWLIPDAYSIPCGHCSRKFPPNRTKSTTKPNMYAIVSTEDGRFYIPSSLQKGCQWFIKCNPKEKKGKEKERKQENAGLCITLKSKNNC